MPIESLLPAGSYSAREAVGTRIVRFFLPTIHYLFTIESHAFAMAIGASVLLAFFPFLQLLLSLTQNLLGWDSVVQTIYVGLRDMLPDDPGLVSFVERNLRVAVHTNRGAELLSLVLLIFSANGIFMPLEVALNRLWGFPGNRSYLLNQVISLSLTCACGVLVLTAAVLTSSNLPTLRQLFVSVPLVPQQVTLLGLKIASLPFSVLIFLLVYWVLPNGKVSLKAVWPIAILAGFVIEIAKNIYIWLWPMLDLRHAYGPFFVSVTLLLWGFFSALLVLGGGEMCARRGHRLAQGEDLAHRPSAPAAPAPSEEPAPTEEAVR